MSEYLQDVYETTLFRPIWPSICARLVTNNYFFFTNALCHPASTIGTRCPYRCILVKIGSCTKKWIISNGLCTNWWTVKDVVASHERKGVPAAPVNPKDAVVDAALHLFLLLLLLLPPPPPLPRRLHLHQQAMVFYLSNYIHQLNHYGNGGLGTKFYKSRQNVFRSWV